MSEQKSRKEMLYQTYQAFSVVCHECWLLLNGVPGTTGLSRVGHENVCVHCGRSLYRLRAHMLTNNTDRESRIRSVVEQRIMPRHLRSSDRICYPCWQRCHSLSGNYAANIESPAPWLTC